VVLSSAARRAAKSAVLPLGLFGRRRPGDVVILCYHRVGAGNREIDLPLATFRRHLDRLVERERVVSLDSALSSEDGGGVVLTFDDGFRDFSDHVLPALVGHRLPAVLYLATGFVEGEEEALPGDSLSWSQLEEAVATGLVAVGSHTHRHVRLSKVSETEAQQDLRRSKELIEDRLGVACRHFAYPWGVGINGSDRIVRRLFQTAALHGWKTNRAGRIDPYELGRTPVLRSDGQVFLRAKVAGILDSEGLLYRALGRGPWRKD
jgi:peptidoglycan/xylan/chitin deacetylase (PgdA/CDA1 family)